MMSCPQEVLKHPIHLSQNALDGAAVMRDIPVICDIQEWTASQRWYNACDLSPALTFCGSHATLAKLNLQVRGSFLHTACSDMQGGLAQIFQGTSWSSLLEMQYLASKAPQRFEYLCTLLPEFLLLQATSDHSGDSNKSIHVHYIGISGRQHYVVFHITACRHSSPLSCAQQ